MKIERIPGARIELGKRQHVPYKVEDACPKCKLVHAIDLTNDHLSSPMIGMPAKIYFCCRKCDHEWQRFAILEVTLTVKP